MNNTFKTPSRFMAGLITVILLILFGISYLAPALVVPWLKTDAKFDAALQQTLLTLLVFAVGYYLGSSKGSADANDVMRAQVVANIPSQPTPNAPPPSLPLGEVPAQPAAPAEPVPVVLANTEPVDVTVVPGKTP